DFHVTGVQTCALPIYTTPALRATPPRERRGVSNAPLPWRRGTTRPDRAANGWLRELSRQRIHQLGDGPELFQVLQRRDRALEPRSEERRGGERRSTAR